MKEDVLATLAHVKRHMGTRVLVKLGGAALKAATLPPTVLEDLAVMRSLGLSVILVHGGGPLINEELERRGISWEFLDGQRVTTPEMMDTIETVLFGKVNRRIVRELNLHGIPAIGLSGIEASTLFCKPAGAALGQVGSIEEVDSSLIDSILSTPRRDGKGVMPVIAPIGTDRVSLTFNVNADWAASRIAVSLGIRKMIFLTDQEGILDREGKVISSLDAGELDHLIETGVVKGGMLTKARASLEALRSGVSSIHILNAGRPHALVEELFTDAGVGTLCGARARREGGVE